MVVCMGMIIMCSHIEFCLTWCVFFSDFTSIQFFSKYQLVCNFLTIIGIGNIVITNRDQRKTNEGIRSLQYHLLVLYIGHWRVINYGQLILYV